MAGPKVSIIKRFHCIHNTTIKSNIGSNMFLSLHNFGQKNITIRDIHLENGYTLRGGGGIAMSSQMTDYNVSQKEYVNITNSNFVGNYAKLGGGAVMFAI